MSLKSLVILLLTLCLSVLFSCKKSSMEAVKWLVTGPDKELVEGLRQKAKRDSINRTPEQIEAIKEQQEENARVEQMRQAAIDQMRADGIETATYYDDELETNKKGEMPYYLGLFIFVIIIGTFFFMIWWFVIRKIRNNIRDMSYAKGEVQSKVSEVMDDKRFSNMSAEERDAMQKMKQFLNRNN